MTKPISKSKRQLAQLLIEAGVTQFPDGANWAAQGGDEGRVGFCVDKQVRDGIKWRTNSDSLIRLVEVASRIPNWHQTVLSRDEFDQIVAETAKESLRDQYCESVARTIPEPVTTPTLDQLLQDWRNADDYAQRKQTEADEAAAMRDERWQMVQARAGEMGVIVGQCEPVVVDESVLVITDWRDLRVGDVVEVIGSTNSAWERVEGKELAVAETGDCEDDLLLKSDDGDEWYTSGNTQWRFIRRP